MIPVWAVIFYVFRNNFRKAALIFSVASVALQTMIFAKNYDSFALFSFHYGTQLARIPLPFYNGQRGNVRHKELSRWFFYAYYPAHMIVLLIMKTVLDK